MAIRPRARLLLARNQPDPRPRRPGSHDRARRCGTTSTTSAFAICSSRSSRLRWAPPTERAAREARRRSQNLTTAPRPNPAAPRPAWRRRRRPWSQQADNARIEERGARLRVERGNARPAERLFRRDESDVVGEPQRNKAGRDARAAFAEDAGHSADAERPQGLAEIDPAVRIEPDTLDDDAEVGEAQRGLLRRVRPGDDEGRNIPRASPPGASAREGADACRERRATASGRRRAIARSARDRRPAPSRRRS